jgi:O-antigen ligase
VTGALQDAGVLAAAGAGATVLLAGDPRRRALALLAAPVLCALALLTVVWSTVTHEVRARGAELAVATIVALGVAVVLAFWLRRRPGAFALVALTALPFRVPVTIGGTEANLLVPLYGVIAVGVIAYALEHLRAPTGVPDWWAPEPDRRFRHLELALAAVLVLYGVQALYSPDLEQAVKNVCFFYVPFAVLFRLLAEVRWSRRLLLGALGVVVGLTLLFAAIGFVEFATGRLVISNAKVLEANDLKPYFRVNSLFFDPNIYGRWIAIAMILLAAALLWTRRGREHAAIAGLLAVFWAGLVISLSQSSFAALLVGLAVLAAIRWKAWPIVAATAAFVVAGAAVVLVAPGALNLHTESEAALNHATSGRVDLITGGAKMARDRPVWGFGSGSFAKVYRQRKQLRSERVAAVSHTIPLTIAAEQGIVGEAAYLYLLAAALALFFSGVRDPAETSTHTAARAALAAAFCGLLLHTWIYADFLEDPTTWALLAMAVALRAAPRGGPQPEPYGLATKAEMSGVPRPVT